MTISRWVYKRLDKFSPVYCLVQGEGSNEQTSESIATRVVELSSSDGLVLSGRLKASKRKRRTIDDISVGFQAIGHIFTGLLYSSTRRFE